jgi:hypothetical protein
MTNRSFEIRPVWYVSANHAESQPLATLTESTARYGRGPDAFGIYENEPDGRLSLVIDETTLPDARRVLAECEANAHWANKPEFADDASLDHLR